MPKIFTRWMMVWLLLPAASLADTIHHDLEVRLRTTEGAIEVTDRLRLPPTLRQDPVFDLSADLQVRAENGALEALAATTAGHSRRYRYRGELPDGQLVLHYSGRLTSGDAHPDHAMPVALINDEGVYLDGAAGWYPTFGEHLQSYRLTVALPGSWHGTSTGTRQRQGEKTIWEAAMPQDDIYLLAGPYADYQCRIPQARLEVLLLSADAALASRYQDAAGRYLTLYSDLLGAYPYSHFAVVENRWQTGYGMPAFTLLGSQVLRLPFILDSSLPHEIVHNWWGNGVFLATQGGNWSEGLTAYLADHLIKEMAGQGVEYRRKALARYANFVASGDDFPLSAFRARHDDASQAVGYGKAMMLFHMIRHELGDAEFIAALRDFYQRFRFRRAGFDDLLGVFAAHGLADAAGVRRNWLEKTGAPRLELQSASLTAGNRLTIRIRQTQSGTPYPLNVPVAVTLSGESVARWFNLPMAGREASASWQLPAAPLRLDVDPAYDLFRRLLPGERPASLGRLFGSPVQLLVMPADAAAAERQAWQQLATQWQRRYHNVRLIEDSELEKLPQDTAVWLLGWDNRLIGHMAARFTAAGQSLSPAAASVNGQTVDPQRQAVVLLDPDNERPPLGFIGAHGASSIGRLAGKLTHYGSFGRLLFELPDLKNQLREVLAADHSPLSRLFTAAPRRLKLPAARALNAQLGSDEEWRSVRCQ